MKRTFLNLFGSVFTIIGRVIGAGFITGKEISVFFCRDFSLSGVYAAFVFFFLFIFLLSVCEENALNKIVGFVVAVTGIVIASCMTAALNSLFGSLFTGLFRNTENYKIFTIITVIFSFFICLKGVGAMNVVSSLVMPFVLVFVVVLSLPEERDFILNLSPSGFGGAGFPLLYVGINCLLSSKVISDSLKGFSVAKKMIAAFIVSFVLCACILCIALRVRGKSGDMPFLSALRDNVIYSKIAVVISFNYYNSCRFGLLSLRSCKRKDERFTENRHHARLCYAGEIRVFEYRRNRLSRFWFSRRGVFYRAVRFIRDQFFARV